MDTAVMEQIVALFRGKLNSICSVAAGVEDAELIGSIESSLQEALREVGKASQQALIEEEVRRRDSCGETCDCSQRMAVKDIRSRQVYGRHGEFTISRRYFVCPACGKKRLPLDERLHLQGRFTDTVDELMALVGVMHSSRIASAALEKLSGLCIGATTIMRHTTAMGREAQQQVIEQKPDTPLPEESKRAYVSCDGVMVHTLAGWREMRLGCLFDGQGYTRYVASLSNSNDFGHELRQMVGLAGGHKADELVAVADGAPWIWEQIRTQLPFVDVQIVDFYHAAQQLAELAKHLYGEGNPTAARWLKDKLAILRETGAKALIKKLRQTRAYRRGEPETRRVACYFSTNAQRMNYPVYEQRGYTIGSGTIESACKNVVQMRLKGPGMCWREDSAAAVANLRAVLLSNHWNDFYRRRRSA